VEAKLASVIRNGDWLWKPARSEALVEIQARHSEISLGSVDNPIWTTSKKGYYVSSDTWEVLRDKKEQVEWWKLVWFPMAIPKQAFILWLVMKERLVTGDRLLRWGYKGMSIACSAKISWKVVLTYFLNAVAVIESGIFVWQDVEWPILLLYGKIFFNWGVAIGVLNL
jgi:hypothetical protein